MGDVGAEFDACAKKLDENIKNEMATKGAEATKKLREVEVEILGKPGHGKKYKQLRNRSSAPFEVPAPQSGELRKYWDEETIISGNKVTSKIKSTSDHAEYLENGTRRMSARPFVQRIKRQALIEILNIYNNDFKVDI